MKVFIDGNTGSGKTSTTVYFARLYNYLNPHGNIYSNCNINFLKNFHYTPLMVLPISLLIKKPAMLIFDDTYSFKKILEKYISILAVFERKLDLEVFFTIQYYTMLTREQRALCTEKWIPNITHIKNGKMTNKSEIIIERYKPITQEPKTPFKIRNILELIKGYYDTKQLPIFPTETNIIQEITKFAKDISDIEYNVNLFTNNQNTKKRLIKTICKEKGIEYKR